MKLGIVGAMEIEVADLISSLTESKRQVLAGMTFYEGKLAGVETVIVRSGVGKVNAAVCTQILIDRFGVEEILNTGVAGSLDAQINIGDFVISTDVVHHDVDACVFGYEPGQVPQMPVVSFPADETPAGLPLQTCREVNPDIGVWRGRIASGDQFIADPAVKKRISDTFHASCAEMEGAAIAQTAWLNRVPFVILRAISDKADGSDQMDYPVFEEQAAHHSARLTLELIRRLNANSLSVHCGNPSPVEQKYIRIRQEQESRSRRQG